MKTVRPLSLAVASKYSEFLENTMKTIKRFIVGLVLASAISLTALAGNMPTGDVPPPPDPTQQQSAPQSTDSNSSLSTALVDGLISLLQALAVI